MAERKRAAEAAAQHSDVTDAFRYPKPHPAFKMS